MFAHCVECFRQSEPGLDVDGVESWAFAHEGQEGKHSVKVEGYDQHSE